MNSKARKFYSKIVMICAMFSLLFGASYGAIGGIVKAATITNTTNTSNEIKISNIPSKGEVGSPITINKATGATGVVITLTDPYQNKAELVDDTVTVPTGFAGTVTNNTSSYTFTPSEADTYTLSYVYSPDPETGVKVQGETYKIVVTSGTAKLNWAKNASYTHATEGAIYPLIPHKAVSGANNWYYLPVPTVVDENGDEISGAEAIISVTDASGNQLINTAASDATVSDELAREITVKDADNNDVTLYAFKAGTSKGIYTISYFYRGTDGAKADKTYTVEVLDASAFNPSDYNLTFSFDGTMPETAVLGREVTLPSVSAYMQLKNDKTGDSKKEVSAFTKIKVQKVKANGTKEDVALDGYTFTPAQEGAYYVTYQVVNAYGMESAVNGYTISDVEDTEAPVVQVVENYEVTEEGTGSDKKLVVSEATVNGLVDASYLVPTKFGAGAKHTFKTYNHKVNVDEEIGNGKTYLAVELPAIFASDNVVEYNDIELSREVYNNSNVANVFYLDDMAKNAYDKTVFNGKSVIALGVNTGDTYQGANKSITALFSEAGEYTIRYKATADGLAATPLTFKLTIVESMEDTDAPVITVSSEIPAAIYDDAVLTFAKPTAVDTVDANVKAYTYYYFGNPTIDVGTGDNKINLPAITASTISLKDYLNGEYVTNAGLEMLVSEGVLKAFETDKNGKFALNIEDTNTNSDSTLTVVTYAMDYYYRMNTDSAKKDVAIVNKEIKLINLTDDSTSPSAVSVSRDKTTYNYTDDEKNGYYTTSDSNWETDATFAGEFKNVHQNYEVYLPRVSFTDNSGNENVAINIRVYDPQGGSQRVTTTVENGVAMGGKFTPKYAGDYYIVYTATDESNNISMICFKMTSKDTAVPEIRGTENFPATAQLGKTINLPSISVFDNGEEITYNVGTKAKLVLLPSEDYNTSDFKAKDGLNEFTPSSIATYNFKYTAKDNAGNEAIATFSVVVTDSVNPEINLTTSSSLTWGYESGDTVALGDITDITENGVEMYAPVLNKVPYFSATDDDEVTVSMSLKYNGNSAEQIDDITVDTKTTKFVYSVKNGALNFVPAYGQGKYILTYTAVDASNNKTEYTYTLAVGNTNPPTITLSSTNNVTSAKLNSTLTLDLTANGVKVADDQSLLKNFGTDAKPRYFELKITAPDKTSIEVNYSGTTVTFSQVGTYTFTYTAEDEAGNKQTKTVYVVVSGDEADTKGDSIVWMVIIIILSLLVLAFVIWFFLRDPKNKKGEQVESKKSESKKEAKKDNDDNDKVVV